MTDVECRQMPTRVCPRSMPHGCADGPCMRFEVTEETATDEQKLLWERHFWLTDERK